MNAYKYSGIKLTPEIGTQIIFELFKNDSDLYETSKIREMVLDYHLNKGGLNPTSSLISIIKKSLQSIKSPYLDKPKNGYNSFKINAELKYSDFYLGNRDKKVKDNKTNINNEPKTKENSVKNGWIYFYYFDTYKNLSEIKKEKVFPIKIGKSKNTPDLRIAEQTGTGMPERPTILICVKTQNCDKLESLIHNFFILKNSKNINSVGNEWFNTNKEEIDSLLYFLKNSGIDIEVE